MQKQLISTLLKENMPNLTASEKKVARALIADYPTLGMQPIAKLSSRANVSGPTVIRLVTKLGFAGYPEFQNQLLSEIQERHNSALELYKQKAPQIPKERLLKHCLASFNDALEGSFCDLPSSEFHKVIDVLGNTRRRVYCIGGRFSELVAKYLVLHLHGLRPNCRYLEESDSWQSAQIIDLGKNDVVVAFDFRRYQRDTLEFSEAAAEAGATVILITDPYLSPIAEHATCVLPVQVAGPSPFDTYLPAMGVVEALLAGLVKKFGAKGKARLAKLEKLQAEFEVPDDSR